MGIVRRRAARALCVILLLGPACDRTDHTPPRQAGRASDVRAPGPFVELEAPVERGARTPRWAETRRGLLLSWQTESERNGAAVRFAELTGDDWSSPATIVRAHDLFVNWADFPSVVALGDDSLAAHWLQHNGPGTYAYQIRVAFSPDRGVSWTAPVVPHETETETEHGFVSLVPGPTGLEAVWLDGRAYEGGAEEMSLRAASIPYAGHAGSETVLDSRVCDCCQTSAVRASGGLVVAYRGRSADEIRDIEVVRRTNGSWTAPVTVHRDGWRIDACPVNGPAMAAHGDTVVVAWFTAADDRPRVYAAVSADGGASFGEPVRVDEGRPLGRVAAVSVEGGRTILAWTEMLDGGGAEIRLRAIDGSGSISPPVTAGAGSAARAGGFPSLARRGDDLYVAWTDPDTERIRIVRGPAN